MLLTDNILNLVFHAFKTYVYVDVIRRNFGKELGQALRRLCTILKAYI